MIREPAVAGQFYPASASQLKTVIGQLVEEGLEKKEVVGLVCPHAGYIYSGQVVGSTLSRIEFKDTFVIMGPNHTGKGQPFSIMTEGTWKTPLGEVEIDTELAKQILSASQHLVEDSLAHQNEHSIEVQVPFLQYFKPDVKIVPIILAPADGAAYKEIGREIAGTVKASQKKVVILASSDMSHYEPQETAERKDGEAIDAILSLDADELLKRVGELDISMCGYGPVAALIAAAKELGAKRAELIRYQTSGDTTGDYSGVVGYAGIIIDGIEMSPLVKLAKKTVETYIREGKVIKPGKELPPEMKGRAGVFVSIHKFGQLRGCVGTFEPKRRNVAEEIITNAISSAIDDFRFSPVTSSELGHLTYSVDVLTKAEVVEDKAKLDPKKHGVIVQCGFRRGLLLPDLEGVDTVDQQVDICCQKAGIMPGEPVKLYCFQVKRYK